MSEGARKKVYSVGNRDNFWTRRHYIDNKDLGRRMAFPDMSKSIAAGY